MQLKIGLIFVTLVLGTLLGCAPTQPPLELTFNRGAQMLAAGSPKSAIPFLTQTIVSTPDGPEPLALLALAYALDLQSENALIQAQKVQRKEGEAPGWEAVAVGIAEMTRRRPTPAIASLQRVITQAPADSAILPSARQWLVLAQLLKGDYPGALVTLQTLSNAPPMRSTAMLWWVVIQARQGQTKEASNALAQCAMLEVVSGGRLVFEGNLDDQTLYDGAIAAISIGKLDMATKMLENLQTRKPEGGDTSVWLALLDGSKGSWQGMRNKLVASCENGTLQGRSLANQLMTVVCAIEGRPEAMIDYLLAGQRLMGRDTSPAHPVDMPKPEPVWFSDSMK